MSEAVVAACPSCGWRQAAASLENGHKAATEHNATCGPQRRGFGGDDFRPRPVRVSNVVREDQA